MPVGFPPLPPSWTDLDYVLQRSEIDEKRVDRLLRHSLGRGRSVVIENDVGFESNLQQEFHPCGVETANDSALSN